MKIGYRLKVQGKRVDGIVGDPVTLLWYMGWFVEKAKMVLVDDSDHNQQGRK